MYLHPGITLRMSTKRKSYPSDVSDEEWAYCVRYLALMTEQAPQRVYPLREMFGRDRYPGYSAGSHEPLLKRYAELGLAVVSVKEYFYEQYFRDADHLEACLIQTPLLNNWRTDYRPYDRSADRAALELYVRYNATSRGVRLMGHRKLFVLYVAETGPAA